jgi:undecaprenyl-diphosphatase
LTLIAFVITALPSWALKKQIGHNLENLSLIAWALLIGGVVRWIVDEFCNRPRVLEMEKMVLPQAVFIGAAQILSAIFPGTSRSMCTIAAGQVAGLSRSAALEFSFFLSIPTMFAATSYDFFKTISPDHRSAADAAIAPLVMNNHEWIVLAIGFVISFVVALVVVAWFMRWVRSRGFTPFAIYRIVLGIVLLVLTVRGFF